MRFPQNAKMLFVFSVLLFECRAVYGNPGDVNSTNRTTVIQGGLYYNTPGSRTTFINQNKDGLLLKQGTVVRGLESNASKKLTGNGGTIYLQAKDSIVRLDGTINVNALKQGGFYLGNGGKVIIESRYLYQNGNIFANGINGGLVQMNVEAATLYPAAKITAMGFGGHGGVIGINASNQAVIRAGAILSTSGEVISTYDTNLINIEGGSIVNNQGSIVANGNPPDIALSGLSGPADDSLIAQNPGLLTTRVQRPALVSSKGGTIRLIAGENGSISNTGVLKANGSTQSLPAPPADQPGVFATPEDGGSILLSAGGNIANSGVIRADGGNGGQIRDQFSHRTGGNGGTISLSTLNHIQNNGTIAANGKTTLEDFNPAVRDGGGGGLIAFSYHDMGNNGFIESNGGQAGMGGTGGNGGLIVFSGSKNPTGGGCVKSNGGNGYLGGNAGGIVALDPAHFGQNQFYQNHAGASWMSSSPRPSQPILQLHHNELLVHLDTGLLLINDKGSGAAPSGSFRNSLQHALIRTTDNPEGINDDTIPTPIRDVLVPLAQNGNLVVSNQSSQPLTFDLGSTATYPAWTNLNTLTALSRGKLANQDAWITGVHRLSSPGNPTDIQSIRYSWGGGRQSFITAGDFVNNGILQTQGAAYTGNTLIYAGGRVINP